MEYPGPNPDDHDVHNRLTCVEYPGLVKDPTAMLRTMGGIRTMSSVFSASTKDRLELNFRPDNIYSKPVAATKHTTTGILLKIRVRKPKPGQSTKGVDNVQIVGTVERMYRFENLCDFQYLPIKKVGGWTRYIYDDIMPQGIIKSDWLE
jgi:general transcription factor 3C polypeptide 5 (transcription factor C subunit 1)